MCRGVEVAEFGVQGIVRCFDSGFASLLTDHNLLWAICVTANALDISQHSDSTTRTAEVSLPVIVRERGDNSLVADFACLTLQGINMRDVFGADHAPSSDDKTMSEELTKVLDSLIRREHDSHPGSGRRLGRHLDLARVLLLLEAKRHATSERDIKAAILDSEAQVQEQARYCFDMPNVTRLVAVASSGDTWSWAIIRKSKTDRIKDKKGGEMADVEYETTWSKALLLETQESEDEWVKVVKVVRELLKEAEKEAKEGTTE